MLLLGVVQAQAAGGVAVDSDFDLLDQRVLGTATATVSFSSLSSYAADYQHLQIRAVARSTAAVNERGFYSRLNADTGSNYNSHFLLGTGSSVVSGVVTTNRALTGITSGANLTANSFGAVVIDLLDPFSSSKNKTFRTLSGFTGNASRIDLHSALWMNTAAVTQWDLTSETGDWASGSRFSLYGIKAV